MGQRQLERVALNHLTVAGKIYHWDTNSKGKLEAHAGLGKDCSIFKEQQGLPQ